MPTGDALHAYGHMLVLIVHSFVIRDLLFRLPNHMHAVFPSLNLDFGSPPPVHSTKNSNSIYSSTIRLRGQQRYCRKKSSSSPLRVHTITDNERISC